MRKVLHEFEGEGEGRERGETVWRQSDIIRKGKEMEAKKGKMGKGRGGGANMRYYSDASVGGSSSSVETEGLRDVDGLSSSEIYQNREQEQSDQAENPLPFAVDGC